MQSSLELLKVTIFSNSRCLVHRRLNEWTGRILISWQRNCEKRNLQKLNHQSAFGEIVEKSNLGFGEDNLIVEKVNVLEQSKSVCSDSSKHQLSEDSSIHISTDRAEELNSKAPPVEEVPAVKKSVSFHSSQPTESGISSPSNINKGQELISDVYGMLEAVEAKVLKLKSIYSDSVVDHLSIARVLHLS